MLNYAQTIDKIRTSIDAVTVDKFDVDITAQTLDELNIDITGQTIERIIQAPSYGPSRVITFSALVDVGETVKVFEILGQGMIYGGYVHFFADADTYTYHHFDIDGHTTPRNFNLLRIFNYNLDDNNSWLMYGKINNTTDKYCVFAFSRGVTFDQNYTFYVSRDSDATTWIVLEGNIWYALR